MKKFVVSVIVVCFLTIFFLFGCTHHHTRSASICGVAGGLAGALIDKRSPWRGALIGAILSAAACSAITELSMQATREAAATNQTVTYKKKMENKDYVIQANPIEEDLATGCKKIKNYVWEDGILLSEYEDEVCSEPTYQKKDRYHPPNQTEYRRQPRRY